MASSQHIRKGVFAMDRKKVLAILLCLVLLLALLCGCRRMDPDTYSAAGDYAFSSFKAEGETYDNGKLGIHSMLRLNADGTGSLETGEEEPEVSEITWSQVGNALSIVSGSETISGTLHGNSVQLEINNVTLIFTKK